MNSPGDVLDKIRILLEENLARTTIATWFEDAEAVALEPDRLVIYTPTAFKRDVICDRYAGYVNAALKELFSSDMTVEVLTGHDADSYKTASAPTDDAMPLPENDLVEYTFEEYVVGPSNVFAHAAALAVANNPAKKYNPLFIYGGSGLGKTHLLYAIANHIKKTQPEANIVYKKGEEFTNEIISAIADKDPRSTAAFRDKYRLADLLLLDDIQFIAGKDSTQNEFFHTFNALYEDKKQIVLTSDRPPKEIYTLEERLKSRFESGLLADIQPPDYETRMAILKSKAAKIGLDIPVKYMQYIANNITTNIRQIEGTVKKLMAMKTLLNMELTQETVSAAIKDMLRDNPGMKPTANLIIEEVAAFYGISEDAIRSASRRNDALAPRQAAMYIMREMTGMSLPEIGREFGKDHSTVIHSIKKVEEIIRAGGDQKNEIKDIISNITDR